SAGRGDRQSCLRRKFAARVWLPAAARWKLHAAWTDRHAESAVTRRTEASGLLTEATALARWQLLAASVRRLVAASALPGESAAGLSGNSASAALTGRSAGKVDAAGRRL